MTPPPSHKILMNSRGFTGEYRRSYCGFSAAPIAHDEKGNMQRNYWFSNSRTVTKLENPEEIGQERAPHPQTSRRTTSQKRKRPP